MKRMISPTLLVLAAGMGNCYGGLKQIEPVGPVDETIGECSIYDAIRAGFGKVVFVIRKDVEHQFREARSSMSFKNSIRVQHAQF
jgi:CTP:molybdopterin cytidylyltransferase MocA